MLSYKRSLPLVIGQVVVFGLFFWYFLQYSFLRPHVDIWIDSVIALLLIATMTVNFWILFPLIFKRYSFYVYMVTALIEVLAINTLEYALTSQTVLYLFDNIIHQEGNAVSVLLPIYCNTFLRDFALLVFVGVMADNISLSEKQIENDQELLRSKKQLLVRNQGKICVIDITPIYLCRQEKNYAILYSIDGQRYKKRISLKDLEDLLKTQQFIRISKSDLIRLSSIKKCQDNLLILKDNVVTNAKTAVIGKSFMENVVPVILQFLQNESESEPVCDSSITEMVQTVVSETKIQKLNPKPARVYQYVSFHRNCKLDEIVKETNIPKSTVARYLKELQRQNFIEYVGSKKTGGYRTVD